MYTLRLNTHKQWIHTEMTNIYQHEKLATKLQFLFPTTVDDNDITKNFIFTLQYVDTGNVLHTESLEIDEDLYKETYLRAVLPVDTDITRFAGEVKELKVNMVGSVNGETVSIWTEETTLTVHPLKDLYDFVPDDSLNAMSQMIAKNAAQIEALDILSQSISEEQIDDLAIDEDDKLHVTAKGVIKGDGVEIYRVKNEPDGTNDGVIVISGS